MKKSITLPDGRTVRSGDILLIVRMDDKNGLDIQAAACNGTAGAVEYIDDASQIHLQGKGLAVIPEKDTFRTYDRNDIDHQLWLTLRDAYAQTPEMKAANRKPDCLELAGFRLYYDEGNESIREEGGRFWNDFTEQEKNAVYASYTEKET